MDKYELVVILDASLPQENKDAVVKDVGQVIEKCGGKVVNSHVWIEKHKMTFSLKKRSDATYYLINFEGGSSKLADLKRLLTLNEEILRFLIIKVKK